jgi:hypothetical protein
MGPLLVSALIGVGVKIATDLLTSGVKKALASKGTGPSSFSAALDRARGATTAGTPAAAPAASTAPRLAAADQVPLGTTNFAASVPAASRAYGAASYHRMDVEAP